MNQLFILGCTEMILWPELCCLLHVTITKIYQRAVAERGLKVSPNLSCFYELKFCGNAAVQGILEKVLELARQRTFETAALCFRWPSQGTVALSEGETQENLINGLDFKVNELTYNLICATPLADSLLVMHLTARNDEVGEALDWRLLSYDMDTFQATFPESIPTDTLIAPFLMAELSQQQWSELLAKGAQNDLLVWKKASQVNWSHYGKTLRSLGSPSMRACLSTLL